MSGFGAKKGAVVAKKKEEQAQAEKSVMMKEAGAKPSNTFENLEQELALLADHGPKSHIFCGVVGHENTTKTGTVMDAFMTGIGQDSENMLWVLDFDGGAAACRAAHWGNTPQVRCWDPYVMQTDDRTAYDYPGTHQRVMDIGQFAVQQSVKQMQPGYTGPRLTYFMVTSVDSWDSVCVNNMKITDMGIAKDGIEASDPTKTVGNQWNWSIRTTRFHQLTALCRRLVANGVAVFWETHIKPEVFRDQETGGWKPDWEKHTSNYLNQILWFRKKKVREADGSPTGETHYTVEFHKCKTNPTLQGQERVIFSTAKGREPIWNGLPELREGVM
tara:strand:- start:3180 stop:4169 length:990 start_codon:yes stop_codon:yes gene_type:complete